LFQDRYKSEAIENLLGVLRYIHQNPIKAGMSSSLSDYPWSSYNEYFDKTYLIDSAFVFGLMSKEELEVFNNQENAEKFMDNEKSKFAYKKRVLRNETRRRA